MNGSLNHWLTLFKNQVIQEENSGKTTVLCTALSRIQCFWNLNQCFCLLFHRETYLSLHIVKTTIMILYDKYDTSLNQLFELCFLAILISVLFKLSVCVDTVAMSCKYSQKTDSAAE